MNAKTLSTGAREAFNRDGFLIVRGLFHSAEAAAHGAWIDELSSRPPSVGHEMVYFEDSLSEPGRRVLSRIERFAGEHGGLGSLVRDPRVVGTASALLDDGAVLFKEKINFKMPGGGGFTPHQDIQPGWDTYAPYFISVLIAVDRNTIENGCLELAAGHHHRGLIGRRWEPLEGAELEGLAFEPFPMEPEKGGVSLVPERRAWKLPALGATSA